MALRRPRGQRHVGRGQLQARRAVRRQQLRDEDVRRRPYLPLHDGPGEVRREGHRHRPALHRHGGRSCRPVDPRASRYRCGARGRLRLCHDHRGLGRPRLPLEVLRRLRRRHHARGTARPGQVLRGLHHRQRRGQNREDPGVGERHHARARRHHRDAGPRDRRGEALRHLPGQGPAAARQRRADGPRHLHAGHSHRQRRHQRRQHRVRPGQLLHAGRLWHPHARQRRGNLHRRVHLDRRGGPRL